MIGAASFELEELFQFFGSFLHCCCCVFARLGRVRKPEELAALVTWIASDACSFTTGFTFGASGGRAVW